MNEIQQSERQQTEERTLAATPSFALRPRRQQVARRTRALLAGLAIACVALIILGSLAYTYSLARRSTVAKQSDTAGTVNAVPARLAWTVQSDQTLIRNDQLTWGIKYISATPDEFLFFYATTYRASAQGDLHIQGSSLLTGSAIPLATRNQYLGTLGAYRIGVLHVARHNQKGQVIQLKVTLPTAGTPSSNLPSSNPSSFDLKPLQQIDDSRTNSSLGFSIDSNIFPQVRWYGPVMKQQVSYLATGKGTYLFLEDTNGTIQVISRETYQKIAGPSNPLQ